MPPRSINPDSTRIQRILKISDFKGHLRYYFSATDNSIGLRDAYAHAVMACVHMSTVSFRGFSIKAAGGYIANLASSNLAAKDSLTGMPNRYEIGLFDMLHPEKRMNLMRLDALQLHYQSRKISISLGRQGI
ncbi:MAG: hypothetical protein KJS92_10140, partial [Bacteroidetes bacterium]|nr:hypothetical protein [Bacteroidota bacterium]